MKGGHEFDSIRFVTRIQSGDQNTKSDNEEYEKLKKDFKKIPKRLLFGILTYLVVCLTRQVDPITIYSIVLKP